MKGRRQSVMKSALKLQSEFYKFYKLRTYLICFTRGQHNDNFNIT